MRFGQPLLVIAHGQSVYQIDTAREAAGELRIPYPDMQNVFAINRQALKLGFDARLVNGRLVARVIHPDRQVERQARPFALAADLRARFVWADVSSHQGLLR